MRVGLTHDQRPYHSTHKNDRKNDVFFFFVLIKRQQKSICENCSYLITIHEITAWWQTDSEALLGSVFYFYTVVLRFRYETLNIWSLIRQVKMKKLELNVLESQGTTTSYIYTWAQNTKGI